MLIISSPFPIPQLSFLQVFPALYDWVSYPITILIKKLFQLEMGHIDKKVQPSPFRIELLASLERLLCFCHTGNTSVFATSLMGQLNLSRSAVTDGFPIMSKVFKQPNIIFAMQHGYEINPCKWPIMRNGYPAIASKRAQVLTYSLPHFMVRPSTHPSTLCFKEMGPPDFARMLVVYVWAVAGI